MESLGRFGDLTDDEYADLSYRVDRYHAAWTPDGRTDPDQFLPPPGTRHRAAVVVELIKTDMERRAQAGQPIRVESYLARFRADIPTDRIPVSLLVEEYRLRHRYADRPHFDEFHDRFPFLAASLRRQLGLDAPPPRPADEDLAEAEEEIDETVRTAATPVQPVPNIPAGFVESSFDFVPPAQVPPVTPDPTPVPAVTPESVKPASVPRGHRTTRDDSGSGAWSPVAKPQPEPVGDVLPAEEGYKLLTLLGRGAFGEVYEALAPGGFRVAVKRILRPVDHPSSQGEREALDAIKAMSHPFLIQTHAYWVFRDRLVVVMELADDSLGGRVEFHKGQGRPGVPPDELIPYFEQAGEALDYLHDQSVSHRDVKPENLLLSKGYAKVADFGMARGHEHTLTLVGSEVGTPLYMAPEVWNRKVSLHSDQYSLAGTYVSARLGRRLFDGRSLVDLCYQHLHETPNLDPLPKAEQKVLLKALAKKPGDRYPTCLAFARALREAVLAPPPAPVQPPPRRRTVLGAVVAGALVGGVAIGVGLVAKWFPSGQPQAKAEEPIPPQVELPNPPEPLTPPVGWTAHSESGTAVFNDVMYHKRLTRTEANEELVAILLVPTQPGDPPPFYMLRDKVTNRVFRTVWDRETKDKTSRLSHYLRLHPDDDWFPVAWENGAKTTDGTALGIKDGQAGVPVVGVTVPQAVLVARALGGQLPTYQHWRKAAGATGDDSTRASPAGAAVPGWAQKRAGPIASLAARAYFPYRNLALGLTDGPWPVARASSDVSVHDIHQLVTNGEEWIDGETDSDRVNLDVLRSNGYTRRVTGTHWVSTAVLTFKEIGESRQEVEWLNTTQEVGFRIVLVPK